MSDEIKEILEQLEWYRKIGKKNICYPECVLPNKKAFILLDYITNLQQYYNDNVNKYEELLLKYSDLQEKNERLNNIIDELERHIKTVVYHDIYGEQIIDSILNKLQELKGSE